MEGFAFGRPLVVLQSDDWGRVGVRDREGYEELRDLVVNLGERSYDFYSLETAEDVAAIVALLQRHRDSTGRPACLGMNFIVANVDFAKVSANNFRQIYLRVLAEGFPDGWKRPGLFEAYREGHLRRCIVAGTARHDAFLPAGGRTASRRPGGARYSLANLVEGRGSVHPLAYALGWI